MAGPDPDLALALDLADLADALSLPAFGHARRERKPDGSAVSSVDREIEQRLRASLAERAPQDSILGEELGAGSPAARRWIIDPLDGSEHYLRSIPIWATMLALQDDDGLRVAVVSAPALGRRWWALRGAGAWCDGVRLHVSATARVEDAFVCYSNLFWPRPGEPLAGRLARTLEAARWSAGLESFTGAMVLAEGGADAAITPVGAMWDHAPVALIVQEAGGRVSDFEGRPGVLEGPLLASNGPLHDQLLSLLCA